MFTVVGHNNGNELQMIKQYSAIISEFDTYQGEKKPVILTFYRSCYHSSYYFFIK